MCILHQSLEKKLTHLSKKATIDSLKVIAMVLQKLSSVQYSLSKIVDKNINGYCTRNAGSTAYCTTKHDIKLLKRYIDRIEKDIA